MSFIGDFRLDLNINNCSCGCGQKAKPGMSYIWGHNGKGIPKKYDDICIKVHNRWDHWPMSSLPQLCKCGCGNYAKSGKEYIIGHNGRNKSQSKESNEKRSKALKGKPRFQEIIDKISKANKGQIPWSKGLTKNTNEILAKKSERMKGEKNPFYGKKHSGEVRKIISEKVSIAMKGKFKTDEHLQKISKGLKEFHANLTDEERDKYKKRCSHKVSEETKQKLRVAQLKRFENPKEIEKISKSVFTLWKKEEYRKKHNEGKQAKREKQSISASKRIIKKSYSLERGISGYFFSKKNDKDLHYRSSYELIAYQLLEQLSKVQSYEVEPFAIPYMYDKVIHNTIPDLLITYTDGTKELVEVKPTFKLVDPITDAKLQKMKFFARRKGWGFSIWTEKELRIH